MARAAGVVCGGHDDPHVVVCGGGGSAIAEPIVGRQMQTVGNAPLAAIRSIPAMVWETGSIPAPKGRHAGIDREEYNGLIDTLNERGRLLNLLLHDHQQILQDQRIQFQRISQINWNSIS